MSRIPRIAHFVFGLREQLEPFHPLHYVAIESCRQILRPDSIFLHYRYLPYGTFWDAVRPRLTLCRVELADEVVAARYDQGLVPERYRYAHHADFVRLDALIEHGGVYADIDTVFLKPFPAEFFDENFVIGREAPTPHELTGAVMPSLCNALLMAEPGATFARAWRARMAAALDGSWSNHSGFLAEALSAELPDEVRVEPEESFYAIPCTREGLRTLLDADDLELPRSYTIHLWAHLWWEAQRTDFSSHDAGEFTLSELRAARSPLAKLACPYLPDIDVDDLRT